MTQTSNENFSSCSRVMETAPSSLVGEERSVESSTNVGLHLQRDYVSYWINRWEQHPLYRNHSDWKTAEENVNDILRKQIKFDWERYVLMKDAVWKFKERGKLVTARKPEYIPTRKVGINHDIVVPISYYTMYEGKFTDAKETDLYYETYNIFNYDKRTHHKFSIGNMEAAMRITRHIWSGRIHHRKPRDNWAYVIVPTCYEFLSDLTRELNGYTEEWHARLLHGVVEKDMTDVVQQDIHVVEPRTLDPIVEEKEESCEVDEIINMLQNTKLPEPVTDYPFRWYPKIRPDRRRMKKRTIVHYVSKSYFDDLCEVYLSIGRPDLVLKQRLPVRIDWLRIKAMRQMANQSRHWEAQSNNIIMNQSNCFCLTATYREKLGRIMSQNITMLRRHLDKMLVLSHRGRFSYMTEWDLALFDRQKRKIKIMAKDLDEDMVRQVAVMSTNEFIQVEVPTSYVEEAECAVNKIDHALQNPSANSYAIAIRTLMIILDRWRHAKFDPSKTSKWRAQGDEKPVAAAAKAPAAVAPVGKAELDKPITSGEKKVTVTMVDERAVDKAVVPKVKKQDVKDVNAEQFYTLLNMVKRPMFIDRITWATTDAMAKELKMYILPDVYFSANQKQPTVCQNMNASYVLAMFGSARFSMKVRIQINSVKFQQGRLICFWKPYYDKTRRIDLFNNAVQFPHTMIDASVSNTTEMEIPWTNFRDAFPIYNDTHNEYNYFGTFHIQVWNPLQVGVNGSNDTSISVWMWLEDLKTFQLCNPKDPGSIAFATDIRGFPQEEEAAERTLQSSQVHITSTSTWQPQMMEVALEAGLGLAKDVGANLVESMFDKFLRGSNSKPQGCMPPQPVIPHVMTNSAWGEGPDSSQRLSLSPLSCTKPTKDATGSENMMGLLKEWTRIAVAEWRVEDAENARIINFPVLPMLPAVQATGQTVEDMTCWVGDDKCTGMEQRKAVVTFTDRRCGMQDYLSRGHFYWRGGLKFKYEIVKTNMHSGRLLIRYEPFGTPESAIKECQKLATPGIVWDVNEDSELIMEAPYMSVQPWLNAQFVSEKGTLISNLFDVANGLIEITVVNRLKVTTGISSDVKINIYMSVADDFKFAVPAPLDGIIALRTAVLSPTVTSGDSVLTLFNEFYSIVAYFFRQGATAIFQEIRRGENTYLITRDANKLWYGPYGMFTAGRPNPIPYNEYVARLLMAMKRVGPVSKPNFAVPRFINHEDAFAWLSQLPRTIPSELKQFRDDTGEDIDLAQYQKMLWWFALILIKERGFAITYFPHMPIDANHQIFVYRVIQPREWEPQSKEEKDDKPKMKKINAINPFTTFAPTVSVDKYTFGEDHMDIYKIMKRWNMWASRTVPPTLLDDESTKGDVGNWERGFFTRLLEDIGSMNDRELLNNFATINIPVTPYTYYHKIGDADHIFVDSRYPGSANVISSKNLPFLQGGADGGCVANITHHRFYSELFTWWRGSMRYRFTFQNTCDMLGVPWWMMIIYHPRKFVSWDSSYETIEIMHKKRLRDLSKMGTVLFVGNVMGSIDVEVPYYSRYNKLNLSNSIDETTANGTLQIIVPIRRRSKQICDPATALTDTYIEGCNFDMWTSVGEDMEFTMKRAACNQLLWPAYYEHKPDNMENPVGYDAVVEGPHPEKVHVGNVGTIIKHTRDPGMTSDEQTNAIKTTTTVYKNVLSDFGSIPTIDRAPLLELRQRDWVVQMETESVASSYDEDEVDGIVTAAVGAVRLLPGMVEDFRGLASTAADALASVKTTVEMLGDAVVVMKADSKQVTESIKVTSSTIGNVASFAFNATRIAIFFKGVVDSMQADTWSDRWIPISTCALALGLSPDVVMKAGEWLMSSASAIFGSKKVHENLEPQAYEEVWDQSWTAFLDENAQMFRFIAAGIFTVATFYFTSSAPLHSKVLGFSGSVISKLRNFVVVGSAIKTLDWMWRWVGDTIKLALVTIGDTLSGGMVTAHQMSSHYPEVIAWLKTVEMYKQEAAKSELAWSGDARMQLWLRMDEGEKLMSKINAKMGSLFNTISRGMMVLQSAHDAAVMSRSAAPFREDPFHICLYGIHGVTKSAILTKILSFIANEENYPIKHRFYTRGEDDDYWTGYTGQPVVIIDDLYQDKKAKAIKELIKMKSNMAYPLNMAAIEEKGRCFISKLIGSTTNTSFPKPEDITYPKALWRRRNMLIRVRRIRPIEPGKLASFKDLRFDLLDPCNEHGSEMALKEDIPLDKLMALCSETFHQWTRMQKALVFSGLEGKHVVVPDYGDTAIESKVVVTSLDGMIEMMKKKINVSDEFMTNVLAESSWKEIGDLFENEPMMAILKDRIAFKTYCKNLLPAKAFNEVVRAVREDPYDERIKESVGELITEGHVLVEGSKMTCIINGAVDSDLGSIVEKKTDSGLVYFEAQSDDFDLGSLIAEGETIMAVEATRASQLLARARDNIQEKENLLDGFDCIQTSLSGNLPKKVIHIADDTEMVSFVRSHFLDANTEQQKKIVADCKAVFNYVKEKKGKFSNVTMEEDGHFSCLFSKENAQYWEKNKDGNWIMNFHDQEYQDDKIMDLWTLYEFLIEKWSKDRINEAKDLCKDPVVLSETKIVSSMTKFYDAQRKKITAWFDEHPKITTLMKIGAAIAALFAGYKLMRWACPKIIEMVQNAMCGLFGWSVAKIGEENVNKVVETGKRVGMNVKSSVKDFYVMVKNFMYHSKDPDLIEMAADDEKVALFAEGLTRQMKNTKNVLGLQTASLQSEGSRKVFNAYMLGQDRAVKAEEEVKKQQLAQLSAGIPYQYVPQGSVDPNASALRVKMLKNMCRLTKVENGNVSNLAGIFIEGRTLLLPYHFFQSASPGTIFSMTLLNGVIFWDVYQPERCIKIGGQDSCVYACGPRVGQFAKLIPHFIPEKELNFSQVKATLNVPTEVLCLVIHEVTAKLNSEVKYVVNDEEIINKLVWEYEARTSVGECGAVLMADSTAVRSKILGIHVCGAINENVGAASILFRESIEEAIALLPSFSQVKSNDVVPLSIISGEIDKMKVKPQGNFEYLGAVSPAKESRLPHKSEIEPSAIHGLVREAVTQPAVLTPFDSRNESGKSPLIRAISKYGVPTVPYHPHDLDYVKKDMIAEVNSWPAPMGGRKLSNHEAVFGNDMIDFCDRMNLGASPGYPWILSRPSGEKGKAYLYDINAEDGIHSEDYRHCYEAREALAKTGIRKHSLWTDCLKDERRPLAKIKEGKTRAFVLPPADFVQLCRKYFMAFCVAFYTGHVSTFSAVGMDPYSYDWTRLARKLNKKSHLGFGGDFHSFDGILDPDIMWRVCLIINAWYTHQKSPDYLSEDDIVREVLFEEMIHTYHICTNSIYRSFQGNKSGNPITVLLNTFGHEFYLCLSWLELARMNAPELASLYSMRKFVEETIYGDDGKYAVKHRVIKWFNQEEMSKALSAHNIEYTSESKTEENYGVRRIVEVTFLKNGQSRLEDTELWLAPIALDTVYELTNWVRKSEDPIAQMRENLESAMDFAFHHGRTFYDRFCDEVNSALRKKHLREIATSYEHKRDMFLAKCRA